MVRGLVTDADGGEPLAACAVTLGSRSVQADADGRFFFNVPDGSYTLKAAYVGYKPFSAVLELRADTSVVIRMQPAQISLREVTITAKESTGMTSSSRIDKAAMRHLQPSSFTDLLELVPGNISENPDMGSVNSIRMRETGNISASGSRSDNADYAMSSLGTLFNMDGVPINNDANLQSTGIEAATGRNAMNRGVDMRTLSTDNIESVEIVRGIPSAEYGNLSSGMVDIRRTRRPTPLSARFKADGYSKLFFAGKGISIKDHSLNADAGYLDSKVDPRNNLENFKRINASLRGAFHWESRTSITDWSIAADFNGTIDRAKSDPDISLVKIDEYKSSSRRYSLTSGLTFSFPTVSWLEKLQVNTSAAYQYDRLTRRRQVAPSRAVVAPVSSEEGVHDGAFILGEYIADYLSEGRPLNLYAKIGIAGNAPLAMLSNRWKAGADWSFSKNYGRGQVYDPLRPLTASWTSRPRAFSEIPALNLVSAYAEDVAQMPI
ncbi:MAG: TonB-dependent receptor, partial [Muribaculaceae bacterium]|nr:TonB-dependent receptor [Muribaculaceae bacterium]